MPFSLSGRKLYQIPKKRGILSRGAEAGFNLSKIAEPVITSDVDPRLTQLQTDTAKKLADLDNQLAVLNTSKNEFVEKPVSLNLLKPTNTPEIYDAGGPVGIDSIGGQGNYSGDNTSNEGTTLEGIDTSPTSTGLSALGHVGRGALSASPISLGLGLVGQAYSLGNQSAMAGKGSNTSSYINSALSALTGGLVDTGPTVAEAEAYAIATNTSDEAFGGNATGSLASFNASGLTDAEAGAINADIDAGTIGGYGAYDGIGSALAGPSAGYGAYDGIGSAFSGMGNSDAGGDFGDGGGGGECFLASRSIVRTSFGDKPIEKVSVGEYVINHDGTALNKVMFIEARKIKGLQKFYSPFEDIPPFATLNHPMYLEKGLCAVNNTVYKWLGFCRKVKNPCIEVISEGTEYNLWVNGDGTYVVNDIGVHSIMFDGGFLRKAYDKAALTYPEVLSILHRFGASGAALDNFSSKSVDIRYGGYILNKIVGKFNFVPGLTRLCARAIKSKSSNMKGLTNFVMRFVSTIMSPWAYLKKKHDELLFNFLKAC